MDRKNGSGSFFLSFAIRLVAALTIIVAVAIGAGLGFSLAETTNIRNQENFTEFAPALPTRILDSRGVLITEFAAGERRELVSLDELPRHLIDAVLVREDAGFFEHRGFSVRATARAVYGQLAGRNLGGGSTITQQVAGTLFTDRRERTVRRKVEELWWAFQIERRYTKNEILEIYLNYMYMGSGTFGVEAASRHFFGHSARDVTLAEAAILSVLFSSPNRFNPLRNPNVVMDRQRFVLDRMVDLGFATREDADASFREYWDNFDFRRAPVGAFFTREDAAPWFSEHVRRELDGLMQGSMNFNTDGFTVHTTLNLEHQQSAQRAMDEGLARANRVHAQARARNIRRAELVYTPVVNMLTLLFDLTDISAAVARQDEQRAVSRYISNVNHIVDMTALLFGIDEIKDITTPGFARLNQNAEQNVIEGALVTIENETGRITALIGGSRFEQGNQFIRATQAQRQTGSAFKPLVYSAALDRGMTLSSVIFDVPVVFHNEDGTPYVPLNFRGEWHGPVLLTQAMVRSMNIPSLKILDHVGFDAAISRSAALLDITNPAQIGRTFPRVYPLALGISSHSPLSMARAFAVFANQGRAVTPFSISRIEDRNGRVIMDLEGDLRAQQRRAGENQVISPQNAYVMNRMLQRVVTEGTMAAPAGWGSRLTFQNEDGGSFVMPMAGKTGTTQNWQDAWVIGYSAYYTTAVWFGFDRPGNSLGVELTGSTLSAHVWTDHMSQIHRGLPRRDFERPPGIVYVTVDRDTGMLPTPGSTRGTVSFPFIAGTQPTSNVQVAAVNNAPRPVVGGAAMGNFRGEAFLNSLSRPSLSIDFDDLLGGAVSPSIGSQAVSDDFDFFEFELELELEQFAPSGSGALPADNFGELNLDAGLPSWNSLN